MQRASASSAATTATTSSCITPASRERNSRRCAKAIRSNSTSSSAPKASKPPTWSNSPEQSICRPNCPVRASTSWDTADRLAVRAAIDTGIERSTQCLTERIPMEIIAQLEATRNRTLKYFDLSDEQLGRNYGPGKWPVCYILHHLADAETILFDRIRRVLSEPRQVLWAFDQDAWAKGLNYSHMPLDLSRRIYEAVRTGIIYQARLHYDLDGHREFVHSETGVRTLKDEFEKVASHNEHHLEQIAQALRPRSGKD